MNEWANRTWLNHDVAPVVIVSPLTTWHIKYLWFGLFIHHHHHMEAFTTIVDQLVTHSLTLHYFLFRLQKSSRFQPGSSFELWNVVTGRIGRILTCSAALLLSDIHLSDGFCVDFTTSQFTLLYFWSLNQCSIAPHTPLFPWFIIYYSRALRVQGWNQAASGHRDPLPVHW